MSEKNNSYKKFIPPLAVHLVWASEDFRYHYKPDCEKLDIVSRMILKFRKYLTQDNEKPFSRELNVPTFLYCSNNPKNPPDISLKEGAEYNVVFIFTDWRMIECNMVSKDGENGIKWNNYVKNMPSMFPNILHEGECTIPKVTIIPVPVDPKGRNFKDLESVKNIEFIDTAEYFKEIGKNKEKIDKGRKKINKNKEKIKEDKQKNKIDRKNKKRIKNKIKNININIGKRYNKISAIEDEIIIKLLHEVYRFGFENKPRDLVAQDRNLYTDEKDLEIESRKSSIKLFLSHTKSDSYKADKAIALKYVRAVQNFIYEANMQSFIDVYDISPGFRFDQEIEKQLSDSTLVAFITDNYSSRYWCQKEVLYIKEKSRPIIGVDCLSVYEDRSLPAASNIPYVRIKNNKLLADSDVRMIILTAILETIRFLYSAKLLNAYYNIKKDKNENFAIISRPPDSTEIFVKISSNEISNYNSSQSLLIYYPEPPLYPEEIELINDKIINGYMIKLSTPIEDNGKPLKIKVGISISQYIGNYDNDLSYEKNMQHLDELKRFSQLLTRHLIMMECILIYGGDLRNDSFTQFIAEEAYIVQKRMHDKKPRIINYLAWPLYNKNKSSEDKWYVKYPQILECKKVEPAEDVKDNIGKTKYIDKDTILNRYVRSRCFTKMREESINDSDVRIFAGGKLRGYSTKMPGILEEFCIAWNSGKPIYLVGGLGGMSQIISNLISDNDTDKKRKEISDNILSEEWQKENNIDTKCSIKYGDMQKYARYKNPKYAADYVEVKDMIRNIKIEDLSARTGLEPGEYKQLMTTPFVDEVVYLIIKGLTKNNETIEGENDNV